MPGFETRHCVTRAAWRSTPGMSGFQTDILPSTHNTVVWNAYEHIILQYEDMNMQDARVFFASEDPSRNASQRPDTFSQWSQYPSPTRKYHPRIYGYPCSVRDRLPGSMQLQKEPVSLATRKRRRSVCTGLGDVGDVVTLDD